MPSSTNSVPDLIFCLRRMNCDNVANNFVTRDSGKSSGYGLLLYNIVTSCGSLLSWLSVIGYKLYLPATHTTSQYFDNNFTFLGVLPINFDLLQAPAYLSEGICGILLGVGCHV